MESSLRQPPLDSITDVAADDDAVLDAVADRRRRTALTRLAECDQTVAVADLAADVAAADGADAERVAIRLFHVHLPVLDEAGLASLDVADRAVAPTPAGEELATALAATGE